VGSKTGLYTIAIALALAGGLIWFVNRSKPVAGAAPLSALRVVRRDGGSHPSPNAGRCEAAFAGALGVRLGGTNVYGGVAEKRDELGEGRAPEPGDIRRAILLSRAVTVSATALAVLAALLTGGVYRRNRKPRAHTISAAMATHHSRWRANPAPATIRMTSRASRKIMSGLLKPEW